MSSLRLVRFAVACATLAAAVSAHAQTATKPSLDAKGQAAPQGFSVVLVLGEGQGTAVAENVPPAARKALADMKDFLPYRGYRLLDAAWILGSQRSTSRLRGPDDNVPAAARRALADMKDFLPYKGYRLLDTQWVLASNSGPAITRLRGADDQEYELELRGTPTMQPGPGGINQTAISVRFFLRESSDGSAAGSGDSGRTALHPKELAKADPVSVEISNQIFQLERERDDLQLLVNKGRKQVEVGTKDPDEVKRQETQLAAVNRRIAELKQSLSTTSSKTAGRAVIDTSFRMEDGETVVVGTSKVKGGGKALIALLTATTGQKKSSSK